MTPKVVRDLPELPGFGQELAVAALTGTHDQARGRRHPAGAAARERAVGPVEGVHSIHRRLGHLSRRGVSSAEQARRRLDLSAREALAATRSTTVPQPVLRAHLASGG